jgi:hypothetical protein
MPDRWARAVCVGSDDDDNNDNNMAVTVWMIQQCGGIAARESGAAVF